MNCTTSYWFGRQEDGRPRQAGFDISVASEVMAVLALTTSLGHATALNGLYWSEQRQAASDRQFGRSGCNDGTDEGAIKPNLMQTLENTPAIIHAGPFANIAHGSLVDCGGPIASTADYLVTEAGFSHIGKKVNINLSG